MTNLNTPKPKANKDPLYDRHLNDEENLWTKEKAEYLKDLFVNKILDKTIKIVDLKDKLLEIIRIEGEVDYENKINLLTDCVYRRLKVLAHKEHEIKSNEAIKGIAEGERNKIAITINVDQKTPKLSRLINKFLKPKGKTEDLIGKFIDNGQELATYNAIAIDILKKEIETLKKLIKLDNELKKFDSKLKSIKHQIDQMGKSFKLSKLWMKTPKNEEAEINKALDKLNEELAEINRELAVLDKADVMDILLLNGNDLLADYELISERLMTLNERFNKIKSKDLAGELDRKTKVVEKSTKREEKLKEENQALLEQIFWNEFGEKVKELADLKANLATTSRQGKTAFEKSTAIITRKYAELLSNVIKYEQDQGLNGLREVMEKLLNTKVINRLFI